VYDIRIPCEVPGLCYDFSHVETFLQDPEVGRGEGREEGGREGGGREKWKMRFDTFEGEKGRDGARESGGIGFSDSNTYLPLNDNRCCVLWGSRPRPARGNPATWR